MTTRRIALPAPTEAEFERTVLELARVFEWKCAHFRAARTANGSWRTPVAGDGRGWPDWVFVRERTVFAELKSAKGRLSPEQIQWLEWLKAADQEAYCWRPGDWDDICRVLGR